MLPLSRLSSFIKEHALFRPDESVLLAVSGGRDSVLMATMFKALGFKFGIAHCNFRLRNEESEKDQEFTADLAVSLDVPFHVISFDTDTYAKSHHVSIQMAARELRYQWLEQIRADSGYAFIAVAHHQNDVIETTLLNLVRGTGISGMRGIAVKKGKIIRPLLFLTREEVDQCIESTGVIFREDLSNKSTKYARNKIRLEVIPLLKQLNPALEETFEANRKRFADLELLLEKTLEELRKKLFIRLHDDEIEINLPELKKLEPLDTLLYGVFKPYGFTGKVLNDLSRSWESESSGKIFSSASHNLIIDRNRLLLVAQQFNLPTAVGIDEAHSLICWNNQKFRSLKTEAEGYLLKKDSTLAQLDMDKLTFPLTLRSWRSGDYFYPLGMNGRKKISDFFVEHKVPRYRKKNIGILENGNGDIIWVAGMRLDDRYKITGKTKKVYTLEQFN